MLSDMAAMCESIGDDIVATVNRDRARQQDADQRSASPRLGLIASLCVPARPEHVSRARKFVRLALEISSVEENVSSTAQLMVSELLTNALRHQRVGAPLPVVLLGRQGSTLWVAVHDGDPYMGERSRPDDESESGRGLVVVEALSDRWGVDRTAAGKSVWCELTAWPIVTTPDCS